MFYWKWPTQSKISSCASYYTEWVWSYVFFITTTRVKKDRMETVPLWPSRVVSTLSQLVYGVYKNNHLEVILLKTKNTLINILNNTVLLLCGCTFRKLPTREFRLFCIVISCVIFEFELRNRFVNGKYE